MDALLCRCFDVTLDTSFTGSTDAIVTLVNAGADVGAPDKDGLRALHCAASRGHKDCAEALVALCGAAPDQQDYNGCSALFYAVTLGHVQCSEFLLNAGTNANAQDKRAGGKFLDFTGTDKECRPLPSFPSTVLLTAEHPRDSWRLCACSIVMAQASG